MSDTSLIFSIIARDVGVGGTLAGIERKFRGVGQEAEDALAKAGASTALLERDIAKLEQGIDKLGAAEQRAALGSEKAELSLAQAQMRSNTLTEKGTALALKREEAEKRRAAAQEAYNKLLGDENAKTSEVAAAQQALNTEQDRYDRLLAQEQQNQVAREMALNRVKVAQLGVNDATQKSEKLGTDRSKAVSELQRLRDELHSTHGDTQNLGSDLTGLAGWLERAGGSAAGLAGSLGSMGASLGSTLSSIGGLIAATALWSAGLAVAGPAIYAFGGAAAALPGLLSGAIAAVFTLKLGMTGLSENWAAMNKPATGGGGGGGAAPVDHTPQIRAVEAAQRSVAKTARDVTDAQTALRDAQLAVAKAHDTARDRLEKLDLEYRQSKVDQADAAQNLLQAEEELRLAQARGNPDEITKAQIAVDRQRLAVEAATDKTEDLGKQNTEAARKGVEGSDEVVAAKKQEAAAQQKLLDSEEAHKLAIQSVGDAQKQLAQSAAAAGAAAAAAAAKVPAIAVAAHDFLNEMKALKPAFDQLRLDIQQRLFEGLADKLRILADRWLPALHAGLGGMADTINGVLKTAFDSLSKPSFISNMMVAMDAFRGSLGKIGQAIAGPLVDAWGRLSAAAGPFITMLGDKIAGLITKFADWIAEMDKTGQLQAFMDKATHVFGKLFDILTDLARIAGDLISILFGTNAGSTDAWDNLATAVHGVADYMGDPKVQANISAFLNIFGSVGFWIGDFLAAMDNIGTGVQNALAWIEAFPQRAGQFLSQLPGVMAHWASAAIQQLGYWIGYGIGWAIRQFLLFPTNVYNAIRQLPAVFSAIGSWLVGAVSGIPGQIFSIGQNIVIGMWNGIASMAQWIWGKVVDFGHWVKNGFKAGFQIGSPSRLMADEIGQWIPKGIAAGMDAHRGTVMDAARRIADDLAGTQLAMPGVDMADATGTLTLATRRLQIEVVSRQVLDVTGQEGKFKTFVRGLARTDNLYQAKG